jgi:hypothetical protein
VNASIREVDAELVILGPKLPIHVPFMAHVCRSKSEFAVLGRIAARRVAVLDV